MVGYLISRKYSARFSYSTPSRVAMLKMRDHTPEYVDGPFSWLRWPMKQFLSKCQQTSFHKCNKCEIIDIKIYAWIIPGLPASRLNYLAGECTPCFSIKRYIFCKCWASLVGEYDNFWICLRFKTFISLVHTKTTCLPGRSQYKFLLVRQRTDTSGFWDLYRMRTSKVL